MLVSFEEKKKKNHTGPEELSGDIEKSFLTESGRCLAKKVLL
jgi:hypothetical protein